MHENKAEEETIDLKEEKEKVKELAKRIKTRLKDPMFWLDNAILIALIIIVAYFGIRGHYIDVKVIETCQGQPILKP